MNALLLQSLTNGMAVAVGLFALWSLVGGMRRAPPAFRARAAAVAGVVAAIATFVATFAIEGLVA